MKTKIVLITILSALFTYSCRKDKPQVKGNDCSPSDISHKVYISNEGKFLAGNGSISLIDANGTCKFEDVYRYYNEQIGLGDVVQSMNLINGSYYVVVNNSQKIVVMNAANYKKLAEINGFTSPRYITAVSSSKAYVSDLFGNKLSIVNTLNNTVTGSLNLPGWTEEMFYSNGKLFVSNSGSNYLYVIDPVSNTINDSIAVGTNSNSIRADKNGKLWVLCGGSSWGTLATGAITRINPVNNQVELSIPFASPYDSPSKLNTNAAMDTLYYISNGIQRMGIADIALPSTTFISSGSMSFYGLGVDPADGTIYVGDAKDFNQKGDAVRYTRNGTLIDKIAVGIAPNGFYFYN
jgi:YVTN family beta-propeller protein